MNGCVLITLFLVELFHIHPNNDIDHAKIGNEID